MNDRDWVLSAIQDLQELANRHDLEQVADALDDVFRVARTELESGHTGTSGDAIEPKPRSVGEVIVFPRQWKPPSAQHL